MCGDTFSDPTLAQPLWSSIQHPLAGWQEALAQSIQMALVQGQEQAMEDWDHKDRIRCEADNEVLFLLAL